MLSTYLFLFISIVEFIALLIIIRSKYASFRAWSANRIDRLLIENTKDGLWSTTRFSFIFTVVVSNLVIWLLIVIYFIANNKFPDVPESMVWMYASANGVAGMTKVASKITEKKNVSESVSQPSSINKDKEIDI